MWLPLARLTGEPGCPKGGGSVADPDRARIVWRKSMASASSNCVEVAFGEESILLRNSKELSGPVLSFTHSEWAAFLSGVRSGEFDSAMPES